MAKIGSESTAIVWAIMHNWAESKAFNDSMRAYRKGVTDGNKGENPGELTEEGFEENVDSLRDEDGNITFSLDENGNIDGEFMPFAGDLRRGVILKCGINNVNGVEGEYSVKISLDFSKSRVDEKYHDIDTGVLKMELIGPSGEIVARSNRIYQTNWYVKGTYADPPRYWHNTTKIWINPSSGSVRGWVEETFRSGKVSHFNLAFSSVVEDGTFGNRDDIFNVMAHAQTMIPA